MRITVGTIATLLAVLVGVSQAADFAGGEIVGGGINQRELYDVLLIIADDVGRQQLKDLYPEGDAAYPSTPNLAALAADGIVLRTFYGGPMCGPTRANLMSSTWAFRHGVYQAFGRVYRIHEWTLPRVIEHALPDTYNVAQFGKLGLYDNTPGVHDVDWGPAAGNYGFERFYGVMGASVLDYCETAPAACSGAGYTRTEMNATGIELSEITYTDTAISDPGTYLPAQTTTDALAWIAAMEAADPMRPWLAVASYHLAHQPFHTPPGGVCNPALNDGEDCYKEMISELDDEIGLLLAGVDLQKTLVIFFGDNGGLFLTAGHGKNSLYESGVALPAIFAGGPVRPNAAIQTGLYGVVDIMPTLLHLVRVQKGWPTSRAVALDVDSSYDGSALQIDGISMLELLLGLSSPTQHDYLLAYKLVGDRCIRNAGYKFCLDGASSDLFTVPADGTDEGADLCTGNCPTGLSGADLDAYNLLQPELVRLEASEP